MAHGVAAGPGTRAGESGGGGAPGGPRISVVVPVYNVEEYLRECLESIAGQTFADLEVILVDDGSTDGSVAIAEEFVARDPRFRLVRQPNAGLGAARNTGTDAATGEFLAFVDSDDVLAPNAYELLLGALDETGSDFATGNVHRLSAQGTRPARFIAHAFAEDRRATHVLKHRPLIADRTAWNKLWRRSFWDAQGYRFPEGVLNEDIPVTVPAHFAARSVDVIAAPIYLWRVREGGALSITQRRLELRALSDRLSATERVLEHLAREGSRRARRWYVESVVANDLRYHLDLLGDADDEYRRMFMERANALLDAAGLSVRLRLRLGLYRRLSAIDRLKWHLVRRRLVPELLEVLRFQREELPETPPVRIRGRFYGDYPFRGDRRLRVPRWVYRLERELWVNARVERMRWERSELRLRGFAYINGIGAPAPDAHRISVTALPRGRLQGVRLRLARLRLAPIARFTTTLVERPDVTADARQAMSDLRWSGFEAALDARRLGIGRRAAARGWNVFVTIRAGRVGRRRARFGIEGPPVPLRATELERPDGVTLRAAPTAEDGIAIDARRGGRARGGDGDGRSPDRPRVGHVAWTENGELELLGELPAGARADELVLAAQDHVERHAFPLEPGGGGGTEFVARVAPAGVASLAGPIPLGEGTWQVFVRGAGEAAMTPVTVPADVYERLPLAHTAEHKTFTIGLTPDGLALLVTRDLDDDERGPYHQRRLRETAYAARRGEPLREAVVYSSFGGRQCSDSPRAVHAELVRRGAPLEHLWVVRDGMVPAPDGARVLREGSREHHDALARSRFVVANDHLPEWLSPRPDQVFLQTWHGGALKRIGLDTGELRLTPGRLRRGSGRRAGDWDYLVSPNRFSTPILRRAHAFEGEVLETGLPRADVLAGPGREDAARRARARLGLGEGTRVVLYAPTYRDHLADPADPARHRLGLELDLRRLGGALGEGTALLFRRHHYVADGLPPEVEGAARDVSGYPDATELLAAVDVLITDYSSAMFDFANTGRPMLFFAYDLDAYRDAIRGLYVDYEDTVPGPVLRTTDEVAEALRDVESVRAAHAQRYDAFRARFCELDDGRATERVVDRVFGG